MKTQTCFFTCFDDCISTQPRKLRGEIVVVDHDSNCAEIVPGTNTLGPDDIQPLVNCLREAWDFMCEREGGNA